MWLISSVPKAGSHAAAAFFDRVGSRRQPGTVLGTTPAQSVHVSGANGVTLDALRMVPDNVYMIAHVCAAHAGVLTGFQIISVVRDPRDCLTSYCRHRRRVDGLDLTIADALEDYWGGGEFVPLYRGFLGWRDEEAMILRYENMHPAVVGNGSGIYCVHDAEHHTRTGSPSNWVDDWSAADHRAFRAAGGRALLEEAGYR